MTTRSKVGCVCFLTAALSSCSTPSEPPSLNVAAPNLTPPPAGMVMIGPGAQLAGIPSEWNATLIHEKEFYPPGDLEILETNRKYPALESPTSAVRFPSEQLCRGLQGNLELSCIEKEQGGVRQHVLVLENLRSKARTEIWATAQPFDVMWAPSDEYVTITHWLSDEISEVILYSLAYKKVFQLSNVFPDELRTFLSVGMRRENWMFRALGWTRGWRPQLVVRGVGHDPRFPRQVYGSEFLVDFYDPDHPYLLRAYRRTGK